MRRTRLNGFAGGLVGGLAAVLVLAAMPALAGDGDPVYVGQKNTGKTVTRLNTRGGLRIDNFRAGNPALILNVADPATPPMLVNSPTRVANLNADMIDGHEAAGLVRVAFASTDNVTDGNGDALTATFTAPRNGYLIIGATMDVYGSTKDFFTCRLRLDAATVTGSTMNVVAHDAGGVHTSNAEQDCTTTGALAITDGEHTVALNVDGRETAQFFEASLWALFVPFDGDGAPYVPPADR